VSFIETYTGRAFWPLDPKVEGLSIIDIAHALSNQGRYSGHTAFFYSVAQHCALLAQFVESRGGNALDCLQMLMHDAAEAYLVDVPRPVKQQMPLYREWDHNVNAVIRQWMGWQAISIPSWQDELDSAIIVDERQQLMSQSGNDWQHKMGPLGIRIEPWSNEEAEQAFLTQYAKYSYAYYGAHQYLNAEWGIPAKIFHDTASDSHEVEDVMEIDLRGGVARIKLRTEDGIMVRDPHAGAFPMPDFQWVHGAYTLTERKAA
jgi:hypothetical protein